MTIIAGIFLLIFGADVAWHLHDNTQSRITPDNTQSRVAQSWDQETLHKEATLMPCADRSYVYGTDKQGNLRICE